jgi:hypothetical protein
MALHNTEQVCYNSARETGRHGGAGPALPPKL